MNTLNPDQNFFRTTYVDSATRFLTSPQYVALMGLVVREGEIRVGELPPILPYIWSLVNVELSRSERRLLFD